MTEKPGKREINKARMRAEIVEVATKSFQEHGYAATSMSAIADELGGSKTTLWSHFSSKEDLFVAVIDHRVECFSEDLERAMKISAFSSATLRALCLKMIAKLLTESSTRLFSLIISEGSRFPEIVEAFSARGPKRLRTNMREFFEMQFEPQAATELSQLVLLCILGFRSDVLTRPARPSNEEITAFVDMMLARLQLDGIAPGESKD
jgi:AcrR family transcriptional regulator